MPSNVLPVSERATTIEELRRFRKFLNGLSLSASRRSGLRRSVDAVIDEVDELAFVLTGNREVLLDPLHRTP